MSVFERDTGLCSLAAKGMPDGRVLVKAGHGPVGYRTWVTVILERHEALLLSDVLAELGVQ